MAPLSCPLDGTRPPLLGKCYRLTLVPLLHQHFFCFPVWLSSAMVFRHLPKTASWKGLPADLTVFSLADLKPVTDHRHLLHSWRLLCFVSSPQRHLAVTSCPRAGLSGTLRGSRVYLLVSQILPTSLSTTLSPPGTSLALPSRVCYHIVSAWSISQQKTKIPELSLREPPKGR